MTTTTRTRAFRYKPEPKEKPFPVTRGCWVYFVTTEDVPDYPIKIGIAFDSVEKRLRSLQTGCPYKLTILAAAPGNTDHETYIHQELHQFRLEGEWFKRSKEVMAHVRKAKQRADYPAAERRRWWEAWDSLPDEVRAKIVAKPDFTLPQRE